ncbi:hypothetical protein JXA32_06530 [Candidatus Sumerlaeota bacterium]|nr:hypothetical protein [Candidatus Sumerlaeota bacterium]
MSESGRFILTPEKNPVQLGDPVWLGVEYVNHTTQTFEIDIQGIGHNNPFVITGPDDKQVDWMGSWAQTGYNPQTFIPDQAVWLFAYDLSDEYLFLEPGDYTVHHHMQESSQIKITISDGRLNSLDRAIRKLKAKLPERWTLKRKFTSHNSSLFRKKDYDEFLRSKTAATDPDRYIKVAPPGFKTTQGKMIHLLYSDDSNYLRLAYILYETREQADEDAEGMKYIVDHTMPGLIDRPGQWFTAEYLGHFNKRYYYLAADDVWSRQWPAAKYDILSAIKSPIAKLIDLPAISLSLMIAFAGGLILAIYNFFRQK